MRSRLLHSLAIVTFIFLFIYITSRQTAKKIAHPPLDRHRPAGAHPSPPTWEENTPEPPSKGSSTPKKAQGGAAHPIEDLIENEQRDFDAVRRRQSKTLQQAVKEYRRRYNMPPPPRFDKWFEFASKRHVQLIDEFDTVHDIITPFWGLKPETIRGRAKEALGGDNYLLGVAIRNNEITHMDGPAQEWQQNATRGMLESFIQYLPDMDLAFNVHDEPRVLVQHDDMSRLVSRARDTNMPAAKAVKSPTNDFSPVTEDLGDGTRFEETKTTRFNTFPRQQTWTNSRMSCPPDSPSRSLEEDEQVDYLSEYGYSELGFIYNTTAMSDICITPSASRTHGFFHSPNAYSVVYDLFPIFSQSKVSSYGDLIYPSPWYWYDKVPYNEELDKPWGEKEDRLYWRGSTTGGFSRRGGWRRQHRQRFVQQINGPGLAKVMTEGDDNKGWTVEEVPRGKHADLIDVKFSHVGQCDPGDCEAQNNFFNPVEPSDQQAAWGYRYLLDMDGNAFSGRFHAFLRSRSLVFKMALFREWHAEWIRPWLHYVPLSLQGGDWLEATRFLAGDRAGGGHAERMAEEGRAWANKVVRKEDMEAWFFRLLLEYARVIDDNREIIGFDPGSAKKKLAA
ncbi:Beta-1,2-xylosyltransferase-like protein [Hapsidospora chrysogenum ATCC 11550]|uniref:Beta-1,2-xylosyltransferase-like protein n=1 Tax=Hapsidospora chrysogenum (strain ATCC 11550 / CBS 779.69 / DSM 880 / IAM 14645 / JCM 23072 / IMI 49137) TaxID=857340 RepID=A0A086TI92_HAPC1|nr:Beta-1,2-xylosyltransferase-like protein [Hapsidospora chrysogenum ATCC 11550]